MKRLFLPNGADGSVLFELSVIATHSVGHTQHRGAGAEAPTFPTADASHHLSSVMRMSARTQRQLRSIAFPKTLTNRALSQFVWSY